MLGRLPLGGFAAPARERELHRTRFIYEPRANRYLWPNKDNLAAMAQHRLTVDTGGTFSDFVYVNEETSEVTVAKVPSTPDDPSRAILAGVEILIARGVSPSDIRYFCHGTTVGTNALLEGKGVRTGLLITKGFRGIYEVAEQSRPHGSAIFDIFYDRPPLLVPESLTGEAAERVSASGELLLPPGET